jgi:hypothetical protein
MSGLIGSMPNRIMTKTFGINPPATFSNGFNNNSTKDIVTGLKNNHNHHYQQQ